MRVFSKDLFSNFKVRWVQYSDKKLEIFLKNNFSFFKNTRKIQLKTLYKRNQINSLNYRINHKRKRDILLKIEKIQKKDTVELFEHRNLILNKLKKSGLPVIIAKSINNKKNYFKFNRELFSFYEYVDGRHFYGSKKDIIATSKATVKLMSVLSAIKINNPEYLNNYKKISYFTIEEDQIIKKLARNKKNWKKIFKGKYKVVKNNWKLILKLRNEAKLAKINKGNLQLCHIDLHPHNFIFKKDSLKAILDFASLNLNFSGYALSFALLKQCRQCFTLNKNRNNMNEIVSNYIKEINSIYKKTLFTKKDLYFLSISEILRRILIIFKFLLIYNDTSWSYVLPIQIRHLREAKKIFKF